MFSIIVPVYKVEKYLHQCVDSLLVQDFDDYEIILVDDGSPDSCPQICDEYAARNERVRVLHKPNGGLSDARNAGLKVASGDYVLFLDGDDFWIGNDSLQKLAYIIQKNPECNFIGFNCSYYYPSADSYSKWIKYDDALSYPTDRNTAICSLVASGVIPMSACLKIIDRQWITGHHIKFEKGLLSEDIPWFINLLDACDKCMFVNSYIYAYRQEVSGSISASIGEKNFNSILKIVISELSLIDKRCFTDEAKDSLRSFLAYEICILISSVRRLPKAQRAQARKKMKNLSYLLGYTRNPKVKMVNRVYKIAGYHVTEIILRTYNLYKQFIRIRKAK